MKQFYLLFLFAMIFNPVFFGQTNQKNEKTLMLKQAELTEKQLILQTEEKFRKAKIEHDVQVIDKILAENYSGTNQFGHIRNKAQTKNLFTTLELNSLTTDSIEVMLLSDSTATLSGLQTENGNQMSFMRNYVKQKGQWRILTSIQKFPEFRNQQGIGSYRLTGYLQGAEGVAMSLIKMVGGSMVNINAAIVKDGVFKMEGKAIEYPEIVFLTTPGKRERASFYLENAEITITGHLDSLAKVKVTGSKTQNEFLAYLTAIDAFKGNFESKSKDLQSAIKIKDTARVVQIKKEIDVIISEVNAIQKDFVINNPKSYATPAILQGLVRTMNPADIELILNSLDPGVAKTPIAIEIKSRIEALKAVDIGKKAPDFTMNDVSGAPVSLSSKIGAKLLLVDFWAAWCGPCRAENPNVVKVYNKFKSKGFDVLGVSLDRNKEEWINAIAKDQLTWTQVSELQYTNSETAKLYAVNSIPANFLLDQNGVIIDKNLRGEALYKKVKELLTGK